MFSQLLISSATLDAEKFSEFFDDAPVFNIPGNVLFAFVVKMDLKRQLKAVDILSRFYIQKLLKQIISMLRWSQLYRYEAVSHCQDYKD